MLHLKLVLIRTIREDLDLRVKHAQGTVDRLEKKGYAALGECRQVACMH